MGYLYKPGRALHRFSHVFLCVVCLVCGYPEVIGLFVGVDELASIESNEVIDFRKHMHEMCERTARDRDSQVNK